MSDPKPPLKITMDRLEQILDAYGASPEAWPASERAAVTALLQSSEQARQLCRQAAELDEVLDAAPSIEPSAELRRRVIGAVPARPPSFAERLDGLAARVWPFGPRWRPAAALVIAAALGIAVGTWMPNDPGATAGTDTASTQDISELVFAGSAYSGDEP